MSTIFFNIMQEFLGSELDRIITGSVSSDVGMLNFWGSKVGIKRNKELSKLKREILSERLIQLKKLESAETDEKNHAVLWEFLLNLKDATLAAAKLKGHGKGTTEGRLEAAITLLTDLYRKFKVFNLVDVNPDNKSNSYTIFRCYSALYVSDRMIEARNPGYFDRVRRSASLGDQQKIADQKEDLLLATLNDCIAPMARIDKRNKGKDPDNAEAIEDRRDALVSRLLKLRANNKELCEKNNLQLPIPVINGSILSLGFSIGNIGPRVGELEECIAATLHVIDPKAAKQEPEESLFDSAPSSYSS